MKFQLKHVLFLSAGILTSYFYYSLNLPSQENISSEEKLDATSRKSSLKIKNKQTQDNALQKPVLTVTKQSKSKTELSGNDSMKNQQFEKDSIENKILKALQSQLNPDSSLEQDDNSILEEIFNNPAESYIAIKNILNSDKVSFTKYPLQRSILLELAENLSSEENEYIDLLKTEVSSGIDLISKDKRFSEYKNTKNTLEFDMSFYEKLDEQSLQRFSAIMNNFQLLIGKIQNDNEKVQTAMNLIESQTNKHIQVYLLRNFCERNVTLKEDILTQVDVSQEIKDKIYDL